MADDEAQVEETTEESPEVEEETTKDSEETENSEESSETTDQEAKHKKAFEDQKRRAEIAEGKLKKLNAGGQSQSASDHSANNARMDRIELTALGIKDREEQDFVLGAAKRLGVEVGVAANDEIVAGKLEKMREARAAKDATPRPKGGGGSTTNNVTKLAEKALQTGELPTDPKLRDQVRTEMRRISK
jgi:hypothetical protein